MINEETIIKLLKAKDKEVEARENRISIEKELIESCNIDNAIYEGTETFKTENYKIKFVKKLSYNIDEKKLRDFPLHEIHKFIDYKPIVNLKNLRQFQTVKPDIVNSVVSTTPLKTAIKIEEVQK